MAAIGAKVKTYLPFLKELQYPEDTHTRKTFPRQRPEPQVFDVHSSDGFTTRLTRYKGKKGPVLMVSTKEKLLLAVLVYPPFRQGLVYLTLTYELTNHLVSLLTNSVARRLSQLWNFRYAFDPS